MNSSIRRMKNKSHIKKIIMIGVLIGILFGASSFIILKINHDRKEKSESVKKMYVCSMEPQIIRDKPGDCPICGMALIEKKDFDENYADSRLNSVVLPVNESVIASVRTVTPVREEMPMIIEASGIINYDSRAVMTVSANFRGLIERSYVKYNFQPIIKGQKMYDIYCPELYIERTNYINLLKKYPDQPEMTGDARNWLEQLGLTQEQIREISTSPKPNYHLSVYSKVEGFVVSAEFKPEQAIDDDDADNIAIGLTSNDNTGIGLSEGVMVEAGDPLFKVVNTKSVRADLKIRNEDAAFLRTGQNVILSDVVNPGRKLKATVNQVEPLNGGLFQLVRIYLTDPEKILIPGMKIHAFIEAGKRPTLWVKKSAVADLGLHSAVFLLQDSSFVAIPVKTGIRSGDKIEICSGIDEHSIIAANASLLTDSDGLIKTFSE
jgi:membrane fusion protein, copper/silver efflux system